MLEKPNLQDKKIVACLQDAYGLQITDITFLPLGADAYAGVYRATTTDGTPYFAKGHEASFRTMVERGAISAGYLSGVKARILLMVALAHTRDVPGLKAIFARAAEPTLANA